MFKCEICEQTITDSNLTISTRLDHCPKCLFSWSDTMLSNIPSSFHSKLWSLPEHIPTYYKCHYREIDVNIVTLVMLTSDHPKEWKHLLSELNQLTSQVLDSQQMLNGKKIPTSIHEKDRYEYFRRKERAISERDAIMYYQIQAQHILYLGTAARLTNDVVKKRLIEERNTARQWFKRMGEHYHAPPLVLFPSL